MPRQRPKLRQPPSRLHDPTSECRATPSSTWAISCASTCPSSDPVCRRVNGVHPVDEDVDAPVGLHSHRRVGQGVGPLVRTAGGLQSHLDSRRRSRSPVFSPSHRSSTPIPANIPLPPPSRCTSPPPRTADGLLTFTVTEHSCPCPIPADSAIPRLQIALMFLSSARLSEGIGTKSVIGRNNFCCRYNEVQAMESATHFRGNHPPPCKPGAAAMPLPWRTWRPWFTPNFAAWRSVPCAARIPAIRSNPPPSSTRPISAWSTSTHVRWQDRAHFFAVAAQMMRRILVDSARARATGKRGGGAVHVNLDESIDAMPDPAAASWSPWTTLSTRWPASIPAKPKSSKCAFSAAYRRRNRRGPQNLSGNRHARLENGPRVADA